MPARHRTAVWLLLLLFAIPGLVFAEERARLEGRVIDEHGKPIPGVVVTATCEQVPTFKEVRTTDKKGGFTIVFYDIDVTYRYRFEKEGFQPLQAQQVWHLEGSQRFEWTMHPGSAPAAGTPPPPSTSEPAVTAYNAGIAALRTGDYAAAETQFKESVKNDPKLILAWTALATAQVRTGHNKEAAEAAEKAISLGARDEAVLTARYQAYKNLKDDAKAAEALKDLQGAGRRAEDAKKIHNEAVGLAKAGNNAAAFEKFQQAVAIDPTLVASQIGLANAALKIGRNAEAVTAAEAAIKVDPKNEQAIKLRYNACLALGDPARLSEALAGMAAVDPVVAKNGLLKLAFDAYDANDKAAAKDRFLKVLAVDQNQPLAHYYLALVYVNEGANAEAKTHLEKFIELAPNAKEAAVARDMLKQLGK